jgi:long-chain acyl-CoA synthetase
MIPRNIAELHRVQAEAFGPRPALRYRRLGLYHDLTWTDYRQQALAGAAALVAAGIEPGDRVGLLSENRVEWLVADVAILAAAAVTVSPHAPLTARQVHFQFADADVHWVITSDREQTAKVQQIRRELPNLRGVVSFNCNAATGNVSSWDAFLQAGRAGLPRLADELRRREQQLGLDDLATIMYTSGTTGNPKGVMLSHGNILSNAEASLRIAPHRPEDVVLTWLPFTHIYARTVDHYKGLFSGVLTCLAESSDTLIQDLEDVRPTHMASVPRFYEKVLAACCAADPATTAANLRRVFGDRIDWLSSGGAPLPVAIAQAYHDAGLMVLQGYGLTESSPVISFNTPAHHKLATVGRALPGVEVKIAADGEILTRGPHVMKGYWNNPAATAEALRDGWLYTGDLGSLDADGFLSITGRKKELMVLSTGKKIVPAYLEGLLLADPCIDQAVVVGEGRSYLTALLVPHWDNITKVMADGEAGTADSEDLKSAIRDMRSPTCKGVYALLRKRVEACLSDVSSMEQVRKFVVLPEPFSVANDEMTVSLKLRRNVVLARHADRIEQMYRDAAGS